MERGLMMSNPRLPDVSGVDVFGTYLMTTFHIKREET